MEIVVENERYNPLLKRKEIFCKIVFDKSTPNRNEVRQRVSGLFNAEVDRIVVDYIKTEFGKAEAKCYIKIYDTKDDLVSIEEEHIIERNFGKMEGGDVKGS
ncbi:MAG: 30S ribosomal protein S24e [Archaeoglobaceae archaeon]|nr:30S ribosomal protein S24e [Archaeoglobaceae archaeon]MDW8013076.1 30S ribosomal protein S24e [Archaeoglobaceae archaeon]